MSSSKRGWALRNFVSLRIVFTVLAAFMASAPVESQAAGGTASGGPGGAASWTTGNKLAVGTSADTASKVWFTVAKGITSEVFYPRLDIPNMQDMQYIITDGSTFVDLERDATNHEVSMPDEKALEYTVTNTDMRATPKYRITNTYITDPSRDTLLIRTRFQSLDGGTYRLYLLENPSMAGGGANDNAWWDGTNSALMSSGTETLSGSPVTVVSALKVASPNGFVAHDNGYAVTASDCYVDLRDHKVLTQPVRQHRQQRQRRAVRPSRQRWRRHDVHCRARLRERCGVGPCSRQRIACGRLHRSRGRLPRNLRTAVAGTATSTGYALHPPACRATRLVAAPTTSPRWPCTPPRTRRSAAPASQGSQRRGATSPMGTISTTATTGCGAATCTSRQQA